MQKIRDKCRLCPVMCNANRSESKGRCGAGSNIIVAKAFLHEWEEPCISGDRGSGTVFFSGCNMHCVFCQNHKISHDYFGKEITVSHLSEIFMALQKQGAANINLVSPTPYAMQIMEAVTIAKSAGLNIPIIYNTNGYEKKETIESLNGIVDIYLPDIKYHREAPAVLYSAAPNYFQYASEAVLSMVQQVGLPEFDSFGYIKKGVLIRHLLLPGLLADSKAILNWIRNYIGADAYVSLMCQYVPCFKSAQYPEINKKIDECDYEEIIDYFFEIGLENGFVQEYSSAATDFIPDFDLSGI